MLRPFCFSRVAADGFRRVRRCRGMRPAAAKPRETLREIGANGLFGSRFPCAAGRERGTLLGLKPLASAFFMSLTWIPALTAKVVGALDRRRLPRTVGAAAASLVLVAVGVVSLVGDGDDAEPKQIMKLEQLPRTGVGGPMADAPASVAAIGSVQANTGDAALFEMSDLGPLPRISTDGRKPMAVYARTYDRAADPRPKVAIVIGGLGFGKALTDAVLERMPVDVSLAFAPQGPEIAAEVATARSKGHEVLLEIPMESSERPTTNTGLHTLTINEDKKNARRMQWLMSRATGYAGLINTFGDSFLATKDEAIFVMAETAKRGLFFVETGGGAESLAPMAAGKMGAPFVRADNIIDKTPSREAIDAELASLEAVAKKRGVAIGVAGALPNTVDRVAVWIASLDGKGIALVPVSALAGVVAVEPMPVASAAPRPAAKPRTPTKQRLSLRSRAQPRATPPKRTTVRRAAPTMKPAVVPVEEPPASTSAPHP